MWTLYDELIDSVPLGLKVRDCLIGQHWTLVESKTTGISMTYKEENAMTELSGRIIGTQVRELARHIKSWNFLEASLGQAAINSVLNTREQVEKLSGRTLEEQDQISAFSFFKEKIQGKKVAVIGHFPKIEDEIGSVCRLSIIERRPQPGDLPDPACEYILPEQDFVFITGTTIVNKTLPRLLQLCKNAFVIMVGPSVPITPALFRYGVDVIAGSIVIDPKSVCQIIKEAGLGPKVFEHGCQMVKIFRSECKL